MNAKSDKLRFRPALETLENRELMSVSSVALNAGTLRIVGNDASDRIEIRKTTPVLTIVNSNPQPTIAFRVGAFPGLTAFGEQVVVTDKTLSSNNVWSFKASDVKRIEVELKGGDDKVDSTVALATKVFGGAGNDTIITGAAADQIFAGSGNDHVRTNAGDDYVMGEDGNDVMYTGAGNDTIIGGAGFNILRGEAGDDRLLSSGRADIVDGGAGYDRFDLVSKTANRTVNGESIRIVVPQDQPQNDRWSCGPNSGSRLLRSYGINVSYSKLRSEVKENSLVSKFRLGTLPSVLRHVISKHKSLTSLETASNLTRVLKLLREGKPVIALVATDKVAIKAGITIGHYGLMHYVVLNGFDEATQRISYVDTNGLQKSWTYTKFDYHWRWFDHFTGAGEALQASLYGLGLRKRTIIF